MPGDMLRMIDEAANDDPVEMQKGFKAYDGCSGQSKLTLLSCGYIFNQIHLLCLQLEFDDECVTASEMYSCGREKEPGLVNAIFNSEKGNATMVRK